jgi:hypothetical protein
LYFLLLFYVNLTGCRRALYQRVPLIVIYPLVQLIYSLFVSKWNYIPKFFPLFSALHPLSEYSSWCILSHLMRYTISFLIAHSHVHSICRRARRAIFAAGLWKPRLISSISPSLPHMSVCAAPSLSHSDMFVRMTYLSYVARIAYAAVHLCLSTLDLFSSALTLCIQVFCVCRLYQQYRALSFTTSSHASHSNPISLNTGIMNSSYMPHMLHPTHHNEMDRDNYIGLQANQQGAVYQYPYVRGSHNNHLSTMQDVRQRQRNYERLTRHSVAGGNNDARNSLICALMNVRSIMNKPILVADFITENRCDLLCITESWLTGDLIMDDAVMMDACPPNYNYISIPRVNKRGGGILFIYKSVLSVCLMKMEFSVTSFEVGLISMKCGANHNIFMAVIYRPPKASQTLFESEFVSLCEMLNNYNEFIIIGDYNLPTKPGTLPPDCLRIPMEMFSLVDHVTSATHESGNILDRLLSRETTQMISNSMVVEGIADHYAVLFQLNSTKPTSEPNASRQTRSFKHMDKDLFKQLIWSEVTNSVFNLQHRRLFLKDDSCTVNIMLRQFNDSIVNILDQLAPLSNYRMRCKPRAPWWNTELTILRRTVRRAERQWRKCKLQVHREIYLMAKGDYHKGLQLTKRKHLAKNIEESIDNTG